VDRRQAWNVLAVGLACFIAMQLFTDFLSWLRAAPPPPPPQVTREGGEYVVDVSWRFEGETYRTVVRVPVSTYEEYRSRVRIPPFDYASFVKADGVVQDLSQTLLRPTAGWSYIRKANYLMRFAQSFKYVTDKESVGRPDYPRYPVETLVDGCGDCEDKAILFASLAKATGMDVVLLLFPREEHIATGLAVPSADGMAVYTVGGRLYAYCETSSTGWEVGEKPSSITSSPWVVPLN